MRRRSRKHENEPPIPSATGHIPKAHGKQQKGVHMLGAEKRGLRGEGAVSAPFLDRPPSVQGSKVRPAPNG